MAMTNYQRNGKLEGDTEKPQKKQKGAVKVDGYQQILEMLKVADDDFRESLLKRLAAKDANLAASLRQNL